MVGLTGVAVPHTGYWRGWPRYTPLICGLAPFVIEVPGFITVGDSPNLHAFIACTTISWLAFFAALRVTTRATAPTRDRSTAAAARSA